MRMAVRCRARSCKLFTCGLSPWAPLQAHIKLGGGVKKAKSKKGPGAKRRAKDLVDQFGWVFSNRSSDYRACAQHPKRAILTLPRQPCRLPCKCLKAA